MKITEPEWLNGQRAPEIINKVVQQYFSSLGIYMAGRVETRKMSEDGKHLHYGTTITVESSVEIPERVLERILEKAEHRPISEYPYKLTVNGENGESDRINIEVHDNCDMGFPSNIDPGSDYLIIYEK